jgi:hypothetical protein
MLGLVGQKLAQANLGQGIALTAASAIAAQSVMVPVAALVGARADAWGRKPLLLAAFVALALRGALYTLSDSTAWLIGVQLLDGVGAGLMGALFPIVVADLTRGSGHFAAAQGAVGAAHGTGAMMSMALGGLLAAWGGYDTAFLVLAAVAAWVPSCSGWRCPKPGARRRWRRPAGPRRNPSPEATRLEADITPRFVCSRGAGGAGASRPSIPELERRHGLAAPVLGRCRLSSVACCSSARHPRRRSSRAGHQDRFGARTAAAGAGHPRLTRWHAVRARRKDASRERPPQRPGDAERAGADERAADRRVRSPCMRRAHAGSRSIEACMVSACRGSAAGAARAV